MGGPFFPNLSSRSRDLFPSVCYFYLLFTGCYPHMSCKINRQPNFPLCFFVFLAMSTEEERLWNIVKANSLDFNAWTALIEETEKVAEVCLSKVSSHFEAVILIKKNEEFISSIFFLYYVTLYVELFHLTNVFTIISSAE